MTGAALRLSVAFGESLTHGPDLAGDALMARLSGHGLAGSTLLRGIEGYGLHGRLAAARFPDLSTDLPLLAVAVGSRERVLGALEDVDAVVSRGLVTLEATQLATGGDLGGAELPARGGGAGRLTLYCRAGRGRRAYREAVAVLRRRGARTGVVLPGVDGAPGGRRGHAGLFGGSADTPVAVVALGPPTALRDALPALAELLPRPVATLDTVALVKHEGRLLQPLPGRAGAAGDR
ncbi:MAG: hypothetical protein QOD81_3483, partial [Solirubrobacteraceae bacterium]|nr:hypothetical protein [Solirubrobacteraceae bacterium]